MLSFIMLRCCTWWLWYDMVSFLLRVYVNGKNPPMIHSYINTNKQTFLNFPTPPGSSYLAEGVHAERRRLDELVRGDPFGFAPLEEVLALGDQDGPLG